MKEVYVVTRGNGEYYKILAVFKYKARAKDFMQEYNKRLNKNQKYLEARIEHHLLISDVWGYELIENINLENEGKQTVYDYVRNELEINTTLSCVDRILNTKFNTCMKDPIVSCETCWTRPMKEEYKKHKTAV